MATFPEAFLSRARSVFSDIDAILGQARHVLNPLESSSPLHHDDAEVPFIVFQTLRDQSLALRDSMVALLRKSGVQPGSSHRNGIEAVRILLDQTVLLAEEFALESVDDAQKLDEDQKQDARRWASLITESLQDMANRLEESTTSPSMLDATHGTSAHLMGNGVAQAERLLAISRHHRIPRIERQLNLLAERERTGMLQVAVVGRCSAGKSSLLNALLDCDALPSGPLRTTTVPVHIHIGAQHRDEVHFSDAASQRIDKQRIAEFATERANEQNCRHVSSIVATVENASLPSDVCWLDMPPLAADAAAVYRYAYLDAVLACHLVVVAINATVPEWEAEADLVRRLCTAGVRVLVVLCKSDQLGADSLMVLEACQSWLWHATGVRAPVAMVSARSGQGLADWRDAVLLPRLKALREEKSHSYVVAQYNLRMQLLGELKRRAVLLRAHATAWPRQTASAASMTLINKAQATARPDIPLVDDLLTQAVRTCAHNAAELMIADGLMLDMTDILTTTANALVASEASAWWRHMLALRAQINMLMSQGPEEAWRWTILFERMPLPSSPPAFDCRNALPASIVRRPQMAEVSHWVAAHTLARRLYSLAAVEVLQEQLVDYLALLTRWRSDYLEALQQVVETNMQHEIRRATDTSQDPVLTQLDEDIRYLSGHVDETACRPT